MLPIECVIDVGESDRERAWYGLRMLLLPFRVSPILVDRAEPEGAWIYYGIDPEAHPDATLRLISFPETWQYFTDSSFASTGPATTSASPMNVRYVRIGEERIPVLFGGGGSLSFDPVASAFYFLSGWQEIETKKRDEHGRFPYEASIQAKLDMAGLPVVDYYRHVVGDLLRKKGFDVQRKQFSDKKWAFCSTHDIDYDRKWRPGIYKRELLDRAVLNQDDETVSVRLRRVVDVGLSLLESGDPFREANKRITLELESRGAKGTFFYKAAAHGSRDVSYNLQDSHTMTALGDQRRTGHEIGLHPSYHSCNHVARMSVEKDRLEYVLSQPVRVHRAHYLRFDYPGSMHLLQHMGFSIDSTLGFAERCGFRFGTCLPFPLFDPLLNVESEVWEFPLCLMESALFNRQKLTRVEAERETNALIQTCASFGGVFVGLWHNTLWDERDYPGWGAHFLSSLEEGRRLGAHFCTLSEALSSWA